MKLDLMVVNRDWNEEIFSSFMSSSLIHRRHQIAASRTGEAFMDDKSQELNHHQPTQEIMNHQRYINFPTTPNVNSIDKYEPSSQVSDFSFPNQKTSGLESTGDNVIGNYADSVLTDDEWLMLSDGDHESTVMVVSMGGIICFTSGNCRNLVGFKREELLQVDLRNFIHPDDYSQMTTEIGYCLQNRKTEFTITMRCITNYQHYILVDLKGRICLFDGPLIEHHKEELMEQPPQLSSSSFFVLVFKDYEKLYSRANCNALSSLPGSDPSHARSIPAVLKPQEDPTLNCIADQRQGLFTAYLSIEDLTFFHVSPLCSGYIGYSPLELCRKSLQSFIHRNELQALMEFFNTIKNNPIDSEASQNECAIRFRVKEGFYTWLLTRLSCYNGYRTQKFSISNNLIRLFEFKRLNSSPADALLPNGCTIPRFPFNNSMSVSWNY